MSAALPDHARNFIAGHWTGGASGTTTNPSTGATVGAYAAATATDVDAAVIAARYAFEIGGWSNNARVRATAMLAMADTLAARRASICAMAVAESGKRTAEIGHEFDAAISELRYYAGVARTIFGRFQETGEGALSIYAREPIGVVAIIVPWNGPITLLIRSLGPVLATGCTAVIKAAPQISLTNGLIVEALAAAVGLPTGVINTLNDQGTEVGKALVAHRQVDAISFTGSHGTAARIVEASAHSLKRLNLELGGKAPALVFGDADFDLAADGIIRSAFVAAGQMCTAVTRVLVTDDAYEPMKSRLAARFAALKVGPADDPTSQMGPVIDARSRDRLAEIVETQCSAAIVRGRAPLDVPPGGFYLSPTLVPVEDLGSPLIQHELFGPIVTLERCAGEADALHRANATVWGLAASVWTRDSARAFRVARSLKSGTVWINAHNRLFAEAETGGYKSSGLGRLHGIEGLDVFLETKHIFLEPGFTPALHTARLG